MAYNLLPLGVEKETVPGTPDAGSGPVGFRPGVLFNPELGDFPRDGRGRVQDSTGIESWKSWVYNCLSTERFKHLAYSSDFGLELDRVFAAGSKQEAESILTRQITEALLADPYGRTAYVEVFRYDWRGADGVEAMIRLHGLEDVTIDITAYLSSEGGR